MVLNGNNTFAGPVLINAGTLKAGSASTTLAQFNTFGTPTAITVADGAALDIGGFAQANVPTGFGATPITISGTGVGGTGALTNSGTVAQQNAFQNVTLNADASVGGTGRMDIRGGTPTLTLNNHTLTKTGTGQFSLVGAAVDAGNFQVNQGTLSIEAAANVDTNGTITLAAGTTLQFYANTGTVTRPITATGAATLLDNSAAGVISTIGSTVTFGGNLTLSDANATATLVLNGALNETGGPLSLTKSGPGLITLGSASNAFSGPVNLNGGLLNFAALGSLGTGTALNFAGGGLQYAASMASPPDLSTRTITFGTGGGTIDTNGNNVTFANAHRQQWDGGFTKAGQGTLVLNGPVLTRARRPSPTAHWC